MTNEESKHNLAKPSPAAPAGIFCRKLKHKIMLWFLMVALLPIGVMGRVSYHMVRESLRQNADEALIAAVGRKAAFLQNWFHYRFVDLEMQATNDRNVQFLQELQSAHESSDLETESFVTSYEWHLLVEARAHDLQSFRSLYDYYDVFLIDVEGNVLFSAVQEDDLGTNLFVGTYSDTRFAHAFRQALQTGKPVFSDIEEYGPSDDAAAGFIAEVMLDESGEKIGVFAIQLTPEQIQYAILSQEDVREHLNAYVIDYSESNRRFTLRSPLHQLSDDEEKLLPTKTYLNHPIETGLTQVWADAYYRERSESGSLALVYNSPSGEEVQGVYRKLALPGVNWGVVAEIPTSVAFAASTRIWGMLIGLVVITSVFVVIMAVMATRRMTQPILEMAAVARQVAEGEFSVSIDTNAKDEFGELAQCFNWMAAKLNMLFFDLEMRGHELKEQSDSLELANEKSHKKEAQTRAILESAPDLIITIDAEGKINDFNPAAEKLFGYSQSGMTGEHISKLYPPKDGNSDHEHTFAWLIEDMHPAVFNQPIEVAAKRIDGSLFPLEITLSEVRHPDALLYMLVGRDVTQRRKEEAVLREAKEAAEHAAKAKSDFLANMSHEIRTPMTAILGFTDILSNDEEVRQDPKQARDAVDTIRANAIYLLTIINDILDLSKIEAGKMTVENVRCQPMQILTEIESLLRARVNAKGLAFDVECVGGIPEFIETDPTRLRQILINLVGNAIKFTEEGGIRIVARYTKEDEKKFLQFDVMDTGIGMSNEQVNRLFQPFTQADNSTTRRFGGTGLGLAISKRFAEMLGGSLTIPHTSKYEGSCFRVTIDPGAIVGERLIEDPRSAMTIARAEPDELAEPMPDIQGCRIMLAEDGPDNQRLISFLLKKSGAKVTLAENGEIAYHTALREKEEGTPFDCILMDMQMPTMSGYEATAALRQAGYTNPIIALTAHAMTGDREKCLKAGCDEFATKPIQRNDLIRAIWRLIQDATDESVNDAA